MPYQAQGTGTRGSKGKRTRRLINIHQNKFPKGYISTLANSRMLVDALSDLTNMEITQDNIPRPRPPMVRYGTQPDLPVIGRGSYRFGGQRVQLFMLDDSGTGQIYSQVDGGNFTLIGGSYDTGVWSGFCQSNGRMYVFNDVDKLSYIKLSDMSIVTYTALSNPSTPTATKTGLVGTTYTYYYKVTANNAVGESAASIADTETVGKIRDLWEATSNFITVTWSAVTDATSYTVYVGDSAGNEKELVTVNALSYIDDGSLAVNPFKLAPQGNATEGPILTWMYNDARNSQVFGVAADNKFWYAAPGTGDFSPYNGGGYVAIDEDGDTQLNYVDGFRTGKGDPVISVSSRGAAGKGKLYHVTFDTLTVGDQAIVFPNVFEANGQSGTYSARAVIKARDSLYYPTGNAFKSTGTSQNIVNILTTNTVSQVIEPDVDKLDLANLYKAAGVEYKDRLYWALPVASTENSEIWYLDLSRKNLWVLRWPIAAKDIWLYEDNNGVSHFCALVNNIILEFSRAGAQTTQDDGVPFRTRTAFSSLVWDEDGIALANIYRQYFKVLQPQGSIMVNAYGLTKTGLSASVGSDSFIRSVSFTGMGQWDYSGDYMYGDDIGEVQSYGQSVAVLTVRPKGLLNQLDWEVVTEASNCDYLLSSVNTRGTGNDNLIYQT